MNEEHFLLLVQILKDEDPGNLPELLGKALGKDGVFIALINDDGSIDSHANHKTSGDNKAARNKSLIRQWCDLLNSNMTDMLGKASKEAAEQTELITKILKVNNENLDTYDYRKK